MRYVTVVEYYAVSEFYNASSENDRIQKTQRVKPN